MKGNKKLIVLVVLLLSFTLAFSACDFDEIFGTFGGTRTNYTIKIEQTIGGSYDTVDSSNFAGVVASNNIAAVFELTSVIEYNYTYTQSGGFPSGNSTASDRTLSSATAFAVNADGYLLTNAHAICLSIDDVSTSTGKNVTSVIYTKRAVFVNFADSADMFPCDILVYDEQLDLCVLKVQDSGKIYNYNSSNRTISQTTDSFTFEEFVYTTTFAHTNPSDSDIDTPVSLFYGESVVAIGNAYGYGIAVTTGVVSAPYRSFVEDDYTTEAIQTDAAINSGNSGGPLFNAYGAVIGINSFKLVAEYVENMAYAIPSYVFIDWLDGLSDGSFDATHTKKVILNGAEANFWGTLSVDYHTTTERAFVSA